MSYYDDWEHVPSRYRVPLTDGSLYRRILQDKLWTDQYGTEWELEEIPPIHRQNLMAWLERRADALHYTHFTTAPKPRYEEMRQEPLEWLHDQPLLRRLHDLTFCPTCCQPILI